MSRRSLNVFSPRPVLPLAALPLLLLVALAGAAESPRPVPPETPEGAPEGYERASCPAVDGELLIPEGWRILGERKSVGGRETATCWVAKDPIAGDPRRFGTGAEITRRSGLTTGMNPREHALRMIERLMIGREVVDRSSQVKGTLFVDRVEVVERTSEGSRHIWAFFAAEPRIGALTVVTLEAPEDEWDESRKTMEPILRSIRLTGGR